MLILFSLFCESEAFKKRSNNERKGQGETEV